jgi:penicillin-insensitive murein endopeptidase
MARHRRRILALLVALAPICLVALPVSAGPRPCWSRSLGFPDRGELRGGRKMPARGRHWMLQPFTFRHGYRWTTCELAQGLPAVADSLTEALHGRPLMIGNLSARGGGEMPHSSSHESGRDVDIALLMCDDQGRPRPSYYHRFDREGVSRSHGQRYRFDVARNWRVVEALLLSPHFEVERLVVASPLREALLAHAEAIGTREPLLDWARSRLVPPWPGVTRHENHFHMRIRCSPADASAGCRERPLPGPET